MHYVAHLRGPGFPHIPVRTCDPASFRANVPTASSPGTYGVLHAGRLRLNNHGRKSGLTVPAARQRCDRAAQPLVFIAALCNDRRTPPVVRYTADHAFPGRPSTPRAPCQNKQPTSPSPRFFHAGEGLCSLLWPSRLHVLPSALAPLAEYCYSSTLAPCVGFRATLGSLATDQSCAQSGLCQR